MIFVLCNYFLLYEGGYVVFFVVGIGIMLLLVMVYVWVVFGVSFMLYYYVSCVQEVVFVIEIVCQLVGGICQIYCLDEGQSLCQWLVQDLGVLDVDIWVYFCGLFGFMVWVCDIVWVVGWGEE